MRRLRHAESMSAASVLAAYETARDAVLLAIAEGRLTVTYIIRGRTHTVSDPVAALKGLEAIIATYRDLASRSTRSPFRLAYLSKPVGTS